MKFFTILPLLFFCLSLSAQEVVISGNVKDQTTQEPLAYVQIGIPGKKIGTLSNEAGQFTFKSEYLEKGDTILFTYLGYETQEFVLDDSLIGADWVIFLEEKAIALPMTTISSRTLGAVKRIGYPKTKGKNKVTGWMNFPPDGNYFKIGERGTTIALDEEVLVKSISFHLAKTDYDSLLFRVHFYDYKDGEIGMELTNDNIYASTKAKKGWVKFDLEKFPIILKNEVLVTIEWVQGWTKMEKNIVLISCGKNGKEVSKNFQNNWTISENQHVGIYLEVKSLN